MDSIAVDIPGKGLSPDRPRGEASVVTFGCRVNGFESEQLAQALKRDRWRMGSDPGQSDLVIVNTCTVTQEADRQARQLVRRIIRRNPQAVIVITGCYAQMDPAACRDIPGVDLVVGNAGKLDIADKVADLLKQPSALVEMGDLHEDLSLPRALLAGYDQQTRAYVQIQQGCDQNCTFCIIHLARGPSRSIDSGLVVRQVQRLVLNGYREVVLCGVDLGHYGHEDVANSEGLTGLLKEILKIDGDFRIRLGSLDPAHITAPLVELMARESRLCPHVHLSIQSANGLILKRMRRRYQAGQLQASVDRLRSALPELVLSADLMVGFPTETADQFQETVEFVENNYIVFPHVFTYSERSGTPAVRFKRQLPVAVRKQRARLLRRVAAEVTASVLRSQLGKRKTLLVEKSADGVIQGRCEDYLPAQLSGAQPAPGELLPVRICAAQSETLQALPD